MLHKEELTWTDPFSTHTHHLEEVSKGQFSWKSSYTDEEGKAHSLSYGIVPPGIYVAVYNLTRTKGE